jgi:ribose transport system ATP-binding protein
MIKNDSQKMSSFFYRKLGELQMERNLILSARQITKIYPGTIANENIGIDFYSGEVLALVGENGAGKSTFIKILSGVIRPTLGYLMFEGKKVEFSNPKDAFDTGIATLHQELNLSEELTVYENIFLGSELKNGFLPKKSDMIMESKKYIELFKESFSPLVKAKLLSPVQKEIVQIIKALIHNSKVILFDEPTAAMEENDVKKLFEIISHLKEEGKSILFVSHKLSEVEEIADRAVVLRNGKKAGELQKEEINQDKLINLMAGKDVEILLHKESKNLEPNYILSVKNLNSSKIRNMSFDLRENEILGFAGLIGSGRTEAMMAMLGVDSSRKVEQIVINGKNVKIRTLSDAMKLGISYLPEERKHFGIFGTLNVSENLGILSLKETAKFGFIKNNIKILDISNKYKAILSINIPSFMDSMSTLSGGNQQKVCIARCLAINPQILILDEPTRGVDVETKAQIYELIKSFVKESKKGVILISSELDEIVSLSDRIAIMYEGSLVKILDNSSKNIKKEELVALMSGNVYEEVV